MKLSAWVGLAANVFGDAAFYKGRANDQIALIIQPVSLASRV